MKFKACTSVNMTKHALRELSIFPFISSLRKRIICLHNITCELNKFVCNMKKGRNPNKKYSNPVKWMVKQTNSHMAGSTNCSLKKIYIKDYITITGSMYMVIFGFKLRDNTQIIYA